MKHNKVFTYGKHALQEALAHAPQALTKVYVDHKNLEKGLMRRIDQSGIAVAKLSEGMARSDMRAGVAHQGVIGAISIPQLMVPFEKFLPGAQAVPGAALVLLNGVQDPHNVGAIIRTAAGFGAAAVIMPEKGTAPVSGAVLKVSAGMAFRIPLVSVATTKHAILELKKKGFKIYALAGEGATPLPQAKFGPAAVFVLGNEGSGIDPEIRKLCDEVLAIPMDKRTESLNVAAAAAVALYAWSTAH